MRSETCGTAAVSKRGRTRQPAELQRAGLASRPDDHKSPRRSEDIPFWIAVPRKEVSVRGDGKPAPVVIMSHGYTSNRFSEVAGFSSFFAQHGLATIGIECPSHGLSISPSEEELAANLLGQQGVGPFGEAALRDRAFDQNNDGRVDSGADFWTAYVFHTRDILRQCAVDHLALVRLLRSFDGERRWDFDLNNDGVKDLAGDFDGDGVVSVSAQPSTWLAAP